MSLEWSRETREMLDQARGMRDGLADLERKIMDAMKAECPIQIGAVIRNKRNGRLGMVNSFGYSPRMSSPLAISPRVRLPKANGEFGLRVQQWYGGEWDIAGHAIGE